MSYEKLLPVDPQPVSEDPGTVVDGGYRVAYDEFAVRLDSGEPVAVSCLVDRAPNSQAYVIRTTARLMNELGGTVVDNSGAHVDTAFALTISASIVQRLTLAAVRRDLLLAVLGEPVESDILQGLNAEVRANVSIREAIATATAADNAANDLDSVL